MAENARRIVLASRPAGEPAAENFRLEDFPVPTPRDGEVLLRTLWLSLDPYMRGRMSDAPSYAAPVGIGEVMEGGAVSEVVVSNNASYKAGDKVLARPAGRPTRFQTARVCASSIASAAPLSYCARHPRHARNDRLLRPR